MKSKKVIIIIIIIFAIGLSIGALLYFKPFKNNKKNERIVSVNIIKKYNYKLEDRDNTLFKTEYDALKKVLSSEEIDYSKYAEALAKLYIIDLYTINNKQNTYDVGSVEYVYPAIKENFELKVKDTLYKYIENDNGSRTQKLPEVSSIVVDEITEGSIIYQDKTMPSYDVKLSWEYIEDLGYDKTAELILVKEDNKLYILEQK